MGVGKLTFTLLLSDHPAMRRLVLTYFSIVFAGVAIAFGAHFLYQSNHLLSDRFSIYRDHGYAEFFQYALAIVAACALLSVALLKKAPAYAVPSAIMAYLFLDDAFRIHERAGAFLAYDRPLTAPLGLSSIHIGEALYLSVVGVSFLGALLYTFLQSNQKVRNDLFMFTAILALAGLFGIVFDALSAITTISLFGFVEDGGELMSVALLSVFAVDRAAVAFHFLALTTSASSTRSSRRLPDDIGNNRHDD